MFKKYSVIALAAILALYGLFSIVTMKNAAGQPMFLIYLSMQGTEVLDALIPWGVGASIVASIITIASFIAHSCERDEATKLWATFAPIVAVFFVFTTLLMVAAPKPETIKAMYGVPASPKGPVVPSANGVFVDHSPVMINGVVYYYDKASNSLRANKAKVE